jgi:hypothetical protein
MRVLSTLTVGVGSIWRIVSRCLLQLLRERCGRLAAEMWVVGGCLLRSLHPFEIYLKIENKEIYGGCGSLYGIERKYEKGVVGKMKGGIDRWI